MKKTIISIFLIVFYSGYSQAIKVDDRDTVEQLVNKILINSPCISGSNIRSSTGINFSSSNGIGYFERNGVNFPIESGIILSTGDVTKAPGPNKSTPLSDGATTWLGDNDLEANLLSQSGITINSINATYIEFDFKPTSTTFSFPFVFASEEYGAAQCEFSDAFAFLIKDLTTGTAYTNLALIPGTNVPVSVETVRDKLFNATCASNNESYFGSYNGDFPTTAINFNGQTNLMTANATGLDINKTYRIKIVIADGNDNIGNDSALFLGISSLIRGIDILGSDYTTENGNAFCAGAVLPTLNSAGTLSAGTIYEWKLNGTTLTQTGSSLNLNTIGLSRGRYTISLKYREPGCVVEVTDEMVIEISPNVAVLPIIPNIYACREVSATSYSFDLGINTRIILAGVNQATTAAGLLDDLPASTRISYHLSNAEAVSNSNALPNGIYSIAGSESERIIYVRIQSATNSCYEIREFKLLVVNAPVIANTPLNLIRCAASYNGTTSYFNFGGQIASIYGTQNRSYNKISFHSTANGAATKTDLLLVDSSSAITTFERTVYVRVFNITNNDCFAVTQFSLKVNPIPIVDALASVTVCVGYRLPALTTSTQQYWTGRNKTGSQLLIGQIINTTTTIYRYDKLGDCPVERPFTINIIDANSFTQTDVTSCNTYRLPSLAFGRYYSQSGGPTTPSNPALSTANLITSTKDIYVYFQDPGNASCTFEKKFTVTIIPFTDLPSYANQFACSSYTLPGEPSGVTYYSASNKGGSILPSGTPITATTTVYVYKETGTTPNCTSEKSFTVFIGIDSITTPTDITSCSTYTLPPLAFGEYRDAPAGGGNSIASGTNITSTQTLYFTIAGQPCLDKAFTITVSIIPLDEILDSAHCDLYQLPAIAHSGDYYTGSQGTGRKLEVGDYIYTTQTIYFYDKLLTGTCYVEEEFIITINPSPLIDVRPTEVIRCDETFILNDLTNGEYYEFPGGPSATNPVLAPGTEIKENKRIYVHAAATATNPCFLEYAIDVYVTYVIPVNDVFTCDSYTLPAIIGPGNYYTQSNGLGTKLNAGDKITLSTTLYIFEENNNRVFCQAEETFQITIYISPVIAPIAAILTCGSYTLPAYPSGVTRYFTRTGGPANANNSEKFPNDVITASTIIYAYAANGTSTTICPAEIEIKITINPVPRPNLTIPAICNDVENNIKYPARITSDLTAPNYSHIWRDEAGNSVGTNSPIFTTDIPGKYTLIVSDDSIIGCIADPKEFEVTESSKPKTVTINTSGWFSNNQTITVTAIPYTGFENNFMYSLDGGLPQSSNIFDNVSAGVHQITIGDGNCVSLTYLTDVKLIYSPKFFTPNGDGLNDTWNISGLPFTQNAKIYIYDRYGKLLKELRPNELQGWDGTFNGLPLPADDYWFTITYIEDGVNKEYKSHFSLKR